MSDIALFTEESLAATILRSRWTKHFALPRYTPPGWWECDVFCMTDARLWTEFEVKLTVSDYRADVMKEKQVGPYVFGEEQAKVRKHDLLAARDPTGPHRFFYVTPPGLLDGEALPAWAGWIEVYPDFGGPNAQLHERIRVKAPRLHGQKRAEDPNHHRGTCYYRFHRLRRDSSMFRSTETMPDLAKNGESK